MTSLDDFAKRKLEAMQAGALLRTLPEPARTAINFCSNDYLGLAHDPRLKAAAATALEHGAGAGASRLVTGNHALYGVLESKIAALKSTEAALVFGSGYLANLGTIPALAGPGDLILADELSHACMMCSAWTAI